MVELSLDLTLALVGLIGTSIAALVWTLKRAMGFADDMRLTLDNHFTTHNIILNNINQSLISMIKGQEDFKEIWESRWDEVLRPGFKIVENLERSKN